MCERLNYEAMDHQLWLFLYGPAETFEVDIGNTKRLLEGERGKIVCEKNIIVSGIFSVNLALHERDVILFCRSC